MSTDGWVSWVGNWSMENPWKTTEKPKKTQKSMKSSWPTGSMYAIYGNIYHQYTPNVSIYTIHGSYGWCVVTCFPNAMDFHAQKSGRSCPFECDEMCAAWNPEGGNLFWSIFLSSVCHIYIYICMSNFVHLRLGDKFISWHLEVSNPWGYS
jgi:hypothetical protein